MSKKIIEALNQDIALELGAITQYMWHHIMATGMESPEISELFLKTAISEMKHAEAFAERLNYYGGIPTTKPAEIMVGGDLKKMIKDDMAGERRGIKQYKEHIKLCIAEDDPVTRFLLEKIVSEEEEHDDAWSNILGVKSLAEEKKK